MTDILNLVETVEWVLAEVEKHLEGVSTGYQGDDGDRISEALHRLGDADVAIGNIKAMLGDTK